MAASPWVMGQEPAARDELDQYLESRKRELDDATLPLNRREAAVLEMVGPLDRAAQAATKPEQKDERWRQAITLLDDFNARNPGHPRAREFQLQAAVYRWAQGQSGLVGLDLNPADALARQRVTAALDDAIARLRAIPVQDADPVLAENFRYRLARALADRADLEPAGSATRPALENEALSQLSTPTAQSELKGFVGLLRADLLRRAGKLDEAEAELNSTLKAEPLPPERDVLDVRIPLLAARKKHGEAVAAISGSHLGDAAKELEMILLKLSELASPVEGGNRFMDELELFRLIDAIRQRNTTETRLALVALALSKLNPDPKHEPKVWDTLAEASEAMGDPARSAALELRAARRADELGQAAAAAGFRVRGGGFVFQAGRWREADELLSRVADDPGAGAVRAKAGMLRCLARGRALENGVPGMTLASYVDALERQVHDFASDPATDEARWLLGTLARAAGERARAESLWRDIAVTSPLWLGCPRAFNVPRLSSRSG
jgi:hypothetical protein